MAKTCFLFLSGKSEIIISDMQNMIEDNENNFTVAVVIPAYNAASVIARAIDSILDQPRQPEQIIVIDDGSTDDTADIVSLYGGRIEYSWQENAGVSAARNAGIKEARCDWVAFLDADDQWLPGKLESQMEILQQNPDLIWATANYDRLAELSQHQAPHLEPEKALEICGNKAFLNSYFEAFSASAEGWTGTMLVRRSVFDEVGGFYEGADFGEDMDMWFRIACLYPKIGYCAEPLAVYHIDTPGSLVKEKGLADVKVLCGFLERNIKNAAEHGKGDEFGLCAELLFRRWVRAMLFAGDGKGVRCMVGEFGFLAGFCYRLAMYVLTICPGLTAMGCRFISRFMKLFSVHRRPGRSME